MSEPVTQNKQLGLLGLLPVEIRHRIYHFVALRDTDFILKVWFEKIDPNIDTSTPTFVSYPAYSEEEDEEDEEDEDEEDEDSDGDEAAAEETAGNNQSAVVNGSGQNRTQGHSEDVTMVDATQVTQPASNTQVSSVPVTASVPVRTVTSTMVQRRTKYRHTVKMYKLDQSPPPVNLLLLSRQIYQEAYNYVYATAGIIFDATMGFPHYSMFEETLDKLISNTLTPLKHFKRVRIDFVWDTEWIQTNKDNLAPDLLVSVLSMRAEKIKELVLSMPKLTDLKITWHDTECSVEGLATQGSITDMFAETIKGSIGGSFKKGGGAVNVIMEETFEQPGTAYDVDTRIGQFRSELDSLRQGFVQIS